MPTWDLLSTVKRGASQSHYGIITWNISAFLQLSCVKPECKIILKRCNIFVKLKCSACKLVWIWKMAMFIELSSVQTVLMPRNTLLAVDHTFSLTCWSCPQVRLQIGHIFPPSYSPSCAIVRMVHIEKELREEYVLKMFSDELWNWITDCISSWIFFFQLCIWHQEQDKSGH